MFSFLEISDASTSMITIMVPLIIPSVSYSSPVTLLINQLYGFVLCAAQGFGEFLDHSMIIMRAFNYMLSRYDGYILAPSRGRLVPSYC